jgi:hypothetical protein
MDYRKLDASLMLELESGGDDQDDLFEVFIRTRPLISDEQVAALSRVGVTQPTLGGTVHTARITRGALAAVSHYPWVEAITLSHPLRPTA